MPEWLGQCRSKSLSTKHLKVEPENPILTNRRNLDWKSQPASPADGLARGNINLASGGDYG